MTPSTAVGRVSPPGWLRNPVHDVGMAFVWVPFAVAAHVVAGDPDALRWLVSATLVLSFAHQPLTLWLAYGDGSQRHAHRVLFTTAPAVAVGAVAVGSSVSPGLLALAAGAWNLAHTVRQRYGISRLYGRLGGVDSSADNRLLWSWAAVAVVLAVAQHDLGELAHQVGLGVRNATAVESLEVVRPAIAVLLPAAAVVGTVLTSRALRAEVQRPVRSVGRLTYLGSTGALLAVLAAEPITGFVAYVGGHAAEYLLVVRWRIDKAAERAAAGDGVGGLARRIGSGGTFALYAAAVVTLVAGLRAMPVSRLALVVTLSLGALHILYDGVIWRSAAPAPAPSTRRPAP